MRAILVGAVESTRIALHAIAAAPDWEVALLVTLPADLAHRHSDFVDLAPEARALGIDVLASADGNAPEVLERMAEAAADCVLVIGWSQLCRAPFLAAAKGRVIGYHPAPLPRLRGRAAIPWTILLDEPISAGTLFWIDEGTDTGDILAQHFFHVARDETAASLYARHMAALEAMLAQALGALARGEEPRVPQDARYATWAARRTPDDGRIDWTRPARDIERLIRASGRPYPGAFTDLGGDTIRIWAAKISSETGRHAALAGQVVVRSAHDFAVLCGDGSTLTITEWESGSGRPPRLHARLG